MIYSQVVLVMFALIGRACKLATFYVINYQRYSLFYFVLVTLNFSKTYECVP